jgi:hypothetical protein
MIFQVKDYRIKTSGQSLTKGTLWQFSNPSVVYFKVSLDNSKSALLTMRIAFFPLQCGNESGVGRTKTV